MPDCIEFCVANPSSAARERLRERGAVERPCLGRCGRCRRERFLVVDGRPATVTDGTGDGNGSESGEEPFAAPGRDRTEAGGSEGCERR